MADPLFQSFFLGGFECATHRRRDRTRIDVLASTQHAARAADDYQLLASAGISSVRDGLRWHLIEAVPGVFDWSSFLPMLDAAHATKTQVIWDLCHWGVPDGLDPFSPDFPTRFAAFAKAAAILIRDRRRHAGVTGLQFFCPINEVSFWSWVGGDLEHFFPYGEGRGPELKRNLVRASIAAIHAVREVDPLARFVQAEPIIHIVAAPAKPEDKAAAISHSNAQFETWDMLMGRRDPELGGSPDLIDLVGVNFYWNNEWIHEGEPTPPGHPLHRPLHRMLEELWQRYGRPIMITETGTESPSAPGWLGYISAEVRQAMHAGVPVAGICLYPITDYPGWDDGRHCPCGLLAIAEDWSDRVLRRDLEDELRVQATVFRSLPMISDIVEP